MILRPCLVSFLVLGCFCTAMAEPSPDSPYHFSKTDPVQVGISAERLEQLNHSVQGFVDRGEIAGAVTLIARRGQIAHCKAYGWRDVETKSPMQTDCIFRMFSMTKPVTCAALMILVEEGKVLLTDPVAKYLPEFAEMKVLIEEIDGEITTVPAERPITLQQLAMHTSGIGYGIPSELSPTLAKQAAEADFFNPNNPLEKAIKSIASFPLLHQPGSTWEYGASIDVLARVIEVVAEQPYGDFLKERLFGPLQMVDTGFMTPEADWDRVASLYTNNGGLKRNLDYEDYYKIGIHHGGGSGLLSTAMDYARFAQMLAHGGTLDGVRILSPQSVQRMATNLIREEENNTPWFNDKAYGFGLGVRVVKDPAYLDTLASVGTWGWNGFATTEFFIDPEEELVSVFLTQYIPTNAKPWWQIYTNMVYQSIQGR